MNETSANGVPGTDKASSRAALYPDFKLTEDNCHQEPIHRPVAIQGQGHMLVIDTSEQPSLYAISDRLASCFGYTSNAIWAEPGFNWLPASVQNLIAEAGTGSHLPRSQLGDATLDEQIFQIVHHQFDGKLTIEFEPEADTQVDDEFVRTTAQAFRQTDALEPLYEQATRLIAQAFGFDRVMIYQFDHDQHGCVVGEHKVDKLEPFLGLHYPESDIPKVAREIFLRMKSRVIPDVDIDYVSLLFNPALGEHPPYLDLSHSQLRATSPIHIQYLKNMGVTATLTFAIVINGKLWGLVACHHYAARKVLFKHRLIGETVADLLAKRIQELEIEKHSKQEEASRAVESRLLENMRMTDSYRLEITDQASLITELCEADGAAIITLDQCIYSTGQVPDNEALLAIRDWLVKEGHVEVFNTAHFKDDVPIPIGDAPPVGGMLASRIYGLSKSYLMWFRQPVSQTVEWAGDPDKSYSIETTPDGGNVHLSPRQSFAKWQVSIEGQSLRWERDTLEMAERVRQAIFKIELRHSAMLVERRNKEFMQLTFSAAHDLREPLRTQASYIKLLNECLGEQEFDELPGIAKRLENATSRMSNLVSDLLDYSSLTTENKREVIALEDLITQILEALEANITESKAVIHIAPLATIRGDTSKVRHCLQNLISNAIKYVEPGKAPEIEIYAEQVDSWFFLKIKDNGIGIEPQYFSKIFVMFQRLHGRDEYQGTGIGLAISAKAAESMGAEIGVTSALGEGSTFWLRLHKSQLI